MKSIKAFFRLFDKVVFRNDQPYLEEKVERYDYVAARGSYTVEDLKKETLALLSHAETMGLDITIGNVRSEKLGVGVFDKEIKIHPTRTATQALMSKGELVFGDYLLKKPAASSQCYTVSIDESDHVVIDYLNSDIQRLVLEKDMSVSIINLPPFNPCFKNELRLILEDRGGRAVSFDALFYGGQIPTHTPNGKDIVSFYNDYQGQVVMEMMVKDIR